MPRRRDAACGPRSFGFAFPGSSGGLPGGRLVGALGHRYGGGLFSFLERDARLSEEMPISRGTGGAQRRRAFGFAFGRSSGSIAIGRGDSSSLSSSRSSSDSSASARQTAFIRSS